VDINDQPSSPRDVTVLVQTYHGTVSGTLASVQPLDPDTVGNYTCNMDQHSRLKLIGKSDWYLTEISLGCFSCMTSSSLKVNSTVVEGWAHNHQNQGSKLTRDRLPP